MPIEPETRRIVVADGDVIVRHAIADYLRDCGYNVIECAHAVEVLTVLEDRTLAIDAVLCDAELGGSRNAFQMRAWIRDQRPEIHVVLAGNVKSAADAAADICEEGPHLERPYDPRLVLDYIKRLAGGR